MTESRVIPGGTPKHLYLAFADNSDVTYTIPTGKRWEVTRIQAQLSATATVGSRVIEVTITSGGNLVFRGTRSGNIAASQIGVVQLLDNWAAVPTAATVALALPSGTVNVSVTCNLPCRSLAAGDVIRIFDTAAIDAAADGVLLVVDYIEYDA